MMKNAYSIAINFNKANQQADKLVKIAGEILTEKNKVRESKRILQMNWKGESASSYMSKLTNLEEKLSGEAKKLQKAAKTIREIAQKTYNSEKRALEIAKVRNYK